MHQVVIIEKENLDRIFSRIDDLTEAVKGLLREEARNSVFTHEEAAGYLKIAKRTLHILKGREIPYTQYGKKLLYQRADLDAFLNRNRVGGRK